MYSSFTKPETQCLLDLMFRLENCGDSEDLNSILSLFHKNFGFDMNNIILVNASDNLLLDRMLGNYPEEFFDRYEQERYYLHDPVWTGFVASDNIFYWGDVKDEYDKNSVLNIIKYEAESVGVVDGCSYTKNLNGRKMIVNLVNDRMIKGSDIHRTKVVTRTLGPNIVRATSKCFDEKKRSEANLSKRQYEALKFLVDGLGRIGISECMDISVKSVDVHLDEAKKKLKVQNRHELLIKAKELFIFD